MDLNSVRWDLEQLISRLFIAATAYLLELGCNGSSSEGRHGTLLNYHFISAFELTIRPLSRHKPGRTHPVSVSWKKRSGDVRFARKNSPDMFRASHRTTTIFWPLSSCLATVLANRPRRWPLPSIVIYHRILNQCPYQQ
jgi:hypothetical protein